MFVYGWPVLELRFGLFTLSFNPMGSFVLTVKGGPDFSKIKNRYDKS